MSIQETIAIAAGLLAVSSSLCGSLYFLLRSGFRLGREVQGNQLRILNLEQKVEDLESKLEKELDYKIRSSRLDREVNRDSTEGMNW